MALIRTLIFSMEKVGGLLSFDRQNIKLKNSPVCADFQIPGIYGIFRENLLNRSWHARHRQN